MKICPSMVPTLGFSLFSLHTRMHTARIQIMDRRNMQNIYLKLLLTDTLITHNTKHVNSPSPSRNTKFRREAYSYRV